MKEGEGEEKGRGELEGRMGREEGNCLIALIFIRVMHLGVLINAFICIS